MRYVALELRKWSESFELHGSMAATIMKSIGQHPFCSLSSPLISTRPFWETLYCPPPWSSFSSATDPISRSQMFSGPPPCNGLNMGDFDQPVVGVVRPTSLYLPEYGHFFNHFVEVGWPASLQPCCLSIA